MVVSSSQLPEAHEKVNEFYISDKDFCCDVMRGRKDRVVEVLNEGAVPNLPHLVKLALITTAREGLLEIATEVLKRVACVEESEVGNLYADALQAAASRGHMDIVTKLLDEGADVKFRGGEYGNALQAAVIGGNIDVVALVISKGAQINAEGGQYETALHAATSFGSRKIVKRLLAAGARADRQDINGFYPLQISLRQRHHEIANLLLPKSTTFLASIKASEWRSCFGGGDDHLELYFDPIPAIRKVSMEEFHRRNYPLLNRTDNDYKVFERSQNFMVNDINSKRIFFLANGTPLGLKRGTGYRCCLWERVNVQSSKDVHRYWEAHDWTRDKTARTSQLAKEDCFVEYRFTTNSITLASAETADGSKSYPIPEITDSPKTHGILWIMTYSEGTTTSEIPLKPKAFFITSEYAQIPPRTSSLLIPLAEELQSEWKKTFESAQSHLLKMRMCLLKTRGLNTNLIQALLKDSLLWDRIEQACRKQVSELKGFRQRHWKPTIPHEPSPQLSEHTLPGDAQDPEESDVKTFSMEVEKLQTFHEVELKALKEMSQTLIQLEFNLTSIAEAQLSRSNNMSMKRLSWVTFIFMPLMFVASVFGMNIDVLASNPPWYWPVMIAVSIAFVAFNVVSFLKWMEQVRRPYPKYSYDLLLVIDLQRKPLIPDLEEGEQDREQEGKKEGWASRWRMTWFSDDRRKRD